MRIGAIGIGLALALVVGGGGGFAADAGKPAVAAIDSRARPLPAHDYQVFFPGDSAELSAAARMVVSRSAEGVFKARAAGQLSHIKVIGYSAATSTPDAAQQLSAQRAGVIRRALIDLGVPAEYIRIESRGQVRASAGGAGPEATNRRARIVLYGPGA